MAAGIEFHKGSLYVATNTKIMRYDNVEDKLDNLGEPKVIYDKLPGGNDHSWKYLRIKDDKLYFDDRRAVQHLRSGRVREDLPHEPRRHRHRDASPPGVRNTVGFDFDPKTGDLWFTDNGRDWFSEELPNDELNVDMTQARSAALRLPVLPSGQHPRSGVRLGQVVRRLRQARRAARAARRLAGPEVLHRQDVPGEVPGRDVHRPPRPVEPHQEVQRRLRWPGPTARAARRSSRS